MSSRKKCPESQISVSLSTIKVVSIHFFLSRLRAKYFSVEVVSLANRECLNPSNCSPKDQSMNVMCTFISVHCLQIHSMPDDMVLIRNPISSQDVSCLAGNIQGFSTVVSLQHGDHLWGSLVLIL